MPQRAIFPFSPLVATVFHLGLKRSFKSQNLKKRMTKTSLQCLNLKKKVITLDG